MGTRQSTARTGKRFVCVRVHSRDHDPAALERLGRLQPALPALTEGSAAGRPRTQGYHMFARTALGKEACASGAQLTTPV